MTPPSTVALPYTGVANADQAWDDFDPFWYLDHNYVRLRADDHEIIRRMGDFFASATRGLPGHGVDVGTGANLYPALAMLPGCHRITMIERSRSNVAWLSNEVRHFGESWLPFWRALIEHRPDHYQEIASPRRALESRAEVVRGNVYSVDQFSPSRFDIGTMFFVAESITGRYDEFRRATHNFVRLLRPRAPFAAAFMKNSSGYWVESQHFPAVKVDEKSIKDCLAVVAYDVEVHTVSTGVNPLRDGYDGMMLATGFAGTRRYPGKK